MSIVVVCNCLVKKLYKNLIHTFLTVINIMVLLEVLTSGVSVGMANIITNPIDVVKVRLQLQHASGSGASLGFVQTGKHIARTEGASAFMNGIAPSIMRGFLFGGVRLGLYTPIKSIISPSSGARLHDKVIAGSLSGGIASLATSPVELVKTRLQSSNTTKSTLETISNVVKENGVKGLWKGAIPGTIRSSMLTASQCATYDEVKRHMLTSGLLPHDGIALHFVSSMLAGFITTTITNPMDVVKTRMYVGGNAYKSPLHCMKSIYMQEGMMGFMKGWSASYSRLGPHTIIMFLMAEKMRSLTGLQKL